MENGKWKIPSQRDAAGGFDVYSPNVTGGLSLNHDLDPIIDVDSLCRGLPGKWHAADGVPAVTSSIFHLTSYINDACGFDAGVFTYQGVDHKELDLIVWCRLSGVVELILFDSTGDGEAIKA